jgi:hypothetical protein
MLRWGLNIKTVVNCELHEESNDNGLRLIGLASALNMVIGSIMFPHKKIATEVPRWQNK